jgi:hypothetical protein
VYQPATALVAQDLFRLVSIDEPKKRIGDAGIVDIAVLIG